MLRNPSVKEFWLVGSSAIVLTFWKTFSPEMRQASTILIFWRNLKTRLCQLTWRSLSSMKPKGWLMPWWPSSHFLIFILIYSYFCPALLLMHFTWFWGLLCFLIAHHTESLCNSTNKWISTRRKLLHWDFYLYQLSMLKTSLWILPFRASAHVDSGAGLTCTSFFFHSQFSLSTCIQASRKA